MQESGTMLKSDKQWLSPGDVALLVHKSTKTVNRWGDQGLLGEVRITDGGQRRYHRAAVETFAASLAAKATIESAAS